MSIKYGGISALTQLITLVKEALSQKASPTAHISATGASALAVQDNSFTEYTALAEALTVTLPEAPMTCGAMLRVTLAEGGSIAGFVGVSFVDGDDFTEAVEGDTWEFSMLGGSVLCRRLTAQ